MRSALATLPGIYEVGVEYDTDSVFVSYDRAAMGEPKPAAKEMSAVLRRAGFQPSWLHAEGWPDGAKADVLPAWRAPAAP